MRNVHLWLGLTSGLLVFVIAITGCLYAFREEIENLTQPYRFVKPQSKRFLCPSELKQIATDSLSGLPLHSIHYPGTGRAAEAIFYRNEPEGYLKVFIHPYDGRILKVKDMNRGFFAFVLDGHFYLWLPHEIGQPVVASATLIFTVLLITGIILWWPRNPNAVKQRFCIRWNTRWRRKAYDLHNVLGFYASWIVIFMALTGLVWGFEWFSKTVYAVASGGREMMPYQLPLSDTTRTTGATIPAIDRVWEMLSKEAPQGASIEVHIPETNTASVAAGINPHPGTYWQTDYRYFDQHTLKELPVNHIWGRINEASAADKIMRMNYDIHVGAIGGLPGKFIAFFASLIVASLPITGILVWWGRKRKRKT